MEIMNGGQIWTEFFVLCLGLLTVYAWDTSKKVPEPMAPIWFFSGWGLLSVAFILQLVVITQTYSVYLERIQ